MPELYSQVLDLKEKDVFLETEVNDTRYFSITGLPPTLSYGKHPFALTFNDPEGAPLLKNLSNIIFEFVDSRGTVIFTDIIDIEELSGAGNGFVWIKKDPLRTADEIADGPAYFYVMGELEGNGIPNQWKGLYNVRSTFEYDIRKDYPNTSNLILKNSLGIQTNLNISESIEFDSADSVFKRSFINVSLTNLETNGGKIDSIELAYNEQKAPTDEYEIITRYPLTSGSYETTNQTTTSGLNPITNTTKIITPKQFRRNTPVRFRLRFVNPAGQLAQYLDENRQGEIVEVTSSFITFEGSPHILESDDNLLSGSMFTGNAVGKGFEQSGKSSAYLKTVDYTGFASASIGSGSAGILFFSGSILSQSGDNYDGVGLELHGGKGSGSFRFRTNPSLLEIQANTFFVGSEDLQFISGSGGQIEISSSDFHLTPQGQVTASSILLGDKGSGQFLQFTNGALTVQGSITADSIRTPASIAGQPSTDQNASSSISVGGFATFKSASIGGFIINPSQIKSTDSSLILNSDGQITGSAVLFGNKTAGQFVQFSNNTLTVQGDITANNIRTPATIDGSPSTDANASASINTQGFAKFVSASIGGFDVGEGGFALDGSNIELDSTNKVISVNSSTFGNTGIQLDFNSGTPRAFIGKAGGEFIKFDGSAVNISSSAFFIGGGGQFISGANQNIEISSSAFHLDPRNNVLVISGTINATDGNIGDFQIIDGQISGSNMTINAPKSQIFKTDQGPGSDTSAAFNQLRDEYYLDFTPSSSNDPVGTDFYIKMGPNFMVDKSGILIASGAIFEGSITASAGLIGGFTTDSHSFSSTNIFISGSPKQGGIDSDEYKFINTQNFNIKQSGDITGSSVLFTGGTIGGFTLDGHSLTTTGVEINDSTQNLFISSSAFKVDHTGNITGSQVLFSGGKIAGFDISGTKLQQGTSFNLDGNASADFFISSSNFQVTPNGDITGSNALFDNTINVTGTGQIAGFGLTTSAISSSNNSLILRSSGQITGSDVLLDGGTIGGFTISSTQISDAGGNLILKANGQITASSANVIGSITSTAGAIGGFTITDTAIKSTNNAVELSSALAGLLIKDGGGTNRVIVKSGSLGTVGGGTQYIGNKSFEDDLAGLSAGRNFVNSITSWSFSEGGSVNISLTDRNAYADDEKAVSGRVTLDVVVPAGSGNYSSPNTYEISQVVTASSDIAVGDTISFSSVARFSSSFGGKGKDRALGPQYFRLEYSGSDTSGFVPFLPEANFTSSNGYGEYFLGSGQYSSFGASADLPGSAKFIKVVLTGSINDDTGFTIEKPLFAGDKGTVNADIKGRKFTKQVVGSTTAEHPETEITFDNFSVRSNTRRVELTEAGLLIYNSEDSFIKMSGAGIEIRGGSGVASFGSAINRESFTNDSQVAGTLGAPALQPYTADPEDIGTTASDGNVAEFAKGNHVHRLTFSTLNSVLGSNTITNGIWNSGFGSTAGASISGSFTAPSSSFSTRITTLEGQDIDDDLNFAGDSGTGTIDLDTETFTIAGGNGLSSVASGNSVTLNMVTGILSSSAQISDDISGSFIAPSSSFSTRITTLEGLDTDDDLNFAGDSGTGTIDFDTETFTIAGGNGLSSVASGNSVTLNMVTGILSSSAQIATQISGAFEGGVGDGTITSFSGSITSTASFGRLETAGGIGANGQVDINAPFAQLRLSDDNFSDFMALGQEGTVGYIKTSDADNKFKFRRGSDNTDVLSIDFGNEQVTASGDLLVGGNIDVGNRKIYGDKAYNNFLRFNASSSLFKIQNKTYVKFDGSSAQREVTINEGTNDIDFVVKGESNNPLFHTDANTGKIGMHGVGTPTAGLHIADNLWVSGSNITASNNISASGNIYGTNLLADSSSFSTRVTTLEGLDTDDDLTIAGDSGGNLSINMDSETLTIAGGTGIDTSGNTNTITVTTNDSEIVHDNLSGFVANEHIDHSSVSVIAGAGLTGGGTITANRTLDIGAGTGVTVNANDIAIGQDVATTSKPLFAAISSSGDISGSSTSTGSFGSLSLAGKVQSNLRLAGSNILYFGDDNNYIQDAGSYLKLRVADGHYFAIHNDSGDTERFRLTDDGKVGIGKTPDQPLDVKADASSAVGLQISYRASGDQRSILRLNNNATSWDFNAVDSSLSIQHSTDGTALTLSNGLDATFGGNVSGSLTSTGSFGSLVVADAVQGDLSVKEGTLTLEKSPAALSWTPGASEMLVLKRHTSSGAFTGMTLQSGGAGKSFINFGDTANNDQGQIAYNNTTDAFEITANTTKVLDITSTKISGSATSTGSFAKLKLTSNITGSDVFTVDGLNGRLFSVTDEMSGSIFSANLISGLPVIEAFSDNRVNLGPFSSPVQIDSSGNISGSATSTGSFGTLRVGSKYGSLTSGLVFSDGNTGLHEVDDNTLAITTAGSERIRIGNTGDIGIGIATNSNFKVYIYDNTDSANAWATQIYQQGAGGNGLRVDVNSTDASDFIFQAGANDGNTEVLNVMADSKVGIGTTGPEGKLHVYSGDAGGSSAIFNRADELVIENSDHAGITIKSPNDKETSVFFGDQDDSSRGGIRYNHATDTLSFQVAVTPLQLTSTKISGSAQSTGSFGAITVGGSTGLNYNEKIGKFGFGSQVTGNEAQLAHFKISSAGSDGVVVIDNDNNSGDASLGFVKSSGVHRYTMGIDNLGVFNLTYQHNLRGGKILSVNGAGTMVLHNASGISGSATSTGSFGRVEASAIDATTTITTPDIFVNAGTGVNNGLFLKRTGNSNGLLFVQNAYGNNSVSSIMSLDNSNTGNGTGQRIDFTFSSSPYISIAGVKEIDSYGGTAALIIKHHRSHVQPDGIGFARFSMLKVSEALGGATGYTGTGAAAAAPSFYVSTGSIYVETGNVSGSASSTGSFGKILQNGQEIAIGQSVGTTDDVTFGSVTINGTSPLLSFDDTNENGEARISGNTGHVSIQADYNNVAPGSRIDFEIDGTHQARLYGPTGDLTLLEGGLVTAGNVSGSSTSTGSFGAGYIDNKLGIGTLVPTENLHVVGELAVEETSAASGKIKFRDTDQAVLGQIGIARTTNDIGSNSVNLDMVYRLEYDNKFMWNQQNTTRMALTSTGLGIGTTSPVEALHVAGKAYVRRTGTATAHGDTDLFVADSTAGGSYGQIQILGGASGASLLYFSDTNSYSVGGIRYFHSDNRMNFRANDTDILDITSTKISGSSSSTGSFGAVAIGKGTADNQRALTIVGNVQLENNNSIYFKRSSGTADPYIKYDSSDNFSIFNPVAGEIQFSVGSGKILDIESTGINFNGSKSLTTSNGAGVITVNGNSGVILKSGTGGGSGPIQFMHGSTVVSEVTTTHAISGSLTSTGSFGVVHAEGIRGLNGTYGGTLFIPEQLALGNDTDTMIRKYTSNVLEFRMGGVDVARFDGNNAKFVVEGAGGVEVESGNIVSFKTNGLISGSATSTGSFGVIFNPDIHDYPTKLRFAGGQAQFEGGYGGKTTFTGQQLTLFNTSGNGAGYLYANHLPQYNYGIQLGAYYGSVAGIQLTAENGAHLYAHMTGSIFEFGSPVTSISGSATSTGSFSRVDSHHSVITHPTSAQLLLTDSGESSDPKHIRIRNEAGDTYIEALNNSYATHKTPLKFDNNTGHVQIMGGQDPTFAQLSVQGIIGINNSNNSAGIRLGYSSTDTTFKIMDTTDGSTQFSIANTTGDIEIGGDISGSVASTGSFGVGYFTGQELGVGTTNTGGNTLYVNSVGNGQSARFATDNVLNYIHITNSGGANHYLQTNQHGLALSADENNTRGTIQLKTSNSTRLNVTSDGHVEPGADDSYNLGSSSKRWADVFAVQTTTGGVFETGLRTEKIGDNPTGTIVSWRGDGLVPCDSNEDELVMGVIKEGKDEPIVMGAEPVLVTGKVDVGDYIVTSDKIGHGKSVKRGYLLKKDLFGKVIAQALEPSDDSDSSLIKCMIRKM